MKRLICAEEMSQVAQSGKKLFYIDDNTIVTPAAKDIAKNNEIEICKNKKEESFDMKNIDLDKTLDLLKILSNQGFLQELIKKLSFKYEALEDSQGFKLIKGNTIVMNKLKCSTGDIHFQELIYDKELDMRTGVLLIKNGYFQYEIEKSEINYLIEGKISIEINGKTYEISEGDYFYVPEKSSIKIKSIKQAKLFIVNTSFNKKED